MNLQELEEYRDKLKRQQAAVSISFPLSVFHTNSNPKAHKHNMVSDHVSVCYDHFCLVLVNISNLQIVLCNFFKSSFVFHFIVLFDMETPNCFCSSAEGVARDF